VLTFLGACCSLIQRSEDPLVRSDGAEVVVSPPFDWILSLAPVRGLLGYFYVLYRIVLCVTDLHGVISRGNTRGSSQIL